MSGIEAWCPVAGYEGLYEVSDCGRVRSLPRARTRGGILAQRIDHHGYPQVNLCRDGIVRTRKVHQLVAVAFLGPRPDGQEVRHLDGDPANSSAGNLAWGTKSENNLDQVRHGTHVQAAKTCCPQGHPYAGENLYSNPNGRRECRTCRLDANRRYRARLARAAA